MKQHEKIRGRLGSWIGASVLALGGLIAPLAASASVDAGDSVYIGSKEGYSGSGMFPIWAEAPAIGDPDFWAYCIENPISARTQLEGAVGNAEDYLGSNYFTDPVIQGKVLWVLAHSYPALTLEEFGAAAGAPGISRNDAIEATQYAIWRYTDLDFDAAWAWETPDSEAAYWHLVNGANASTGMTPDDLAVTATIAAPSAPQTADSLVGPFVVDTNRPTVSVTVDPTVSLVDADGDAIDANAVVDGQALYLDLRGSTAEGSATVSVVAEGLSGTGKIVSVPTTNSPMPTAEDHAQTIILVAPSTATTTDAATVEWSTTAAPAPVIGTSLVDSTDGDRILPWNGGTVVDTVAYQNLTPGTEYTLVGELHDKTDGTATGITESITFVPESANGSIDVIFTVPVGYAGGTLVAFERLYEGPDTTGDPIAVHEDIGDAAQTVTIEKATVSTPTATPGSTVAPGASGQLATTGGDLPDIAVGVAGVLLALGAMILLAGCARRKTIDAD